MHGVQLKTRPKENSNNTQEVALGSKKISDNNKQDKTKNDKILINGKPIEKKKRRYS